MKLSILVCSVLERGQTFLPKILKQLQDQITPYSNDVELLCLIDNCNMMLGEKRNKLVKMADGDYITFVDDDDVLSDDYVKVLLEAIKTTPTDVITFTVNVSLNNGPYKPCYYSKDYKTNYNTDAAYFRQVNHIMCIKLDLALSTPYKSIIRGEDSAFAADLAHKIKTETKLDKVLYYYNFNQETTQTQQIVKRKR